MNIIERVWENQDWIFIILISVFALIVFTRWLFIKNFAGIFDYHSFIENNESVFQFSLIYNILFGVLAALLIYNVIPYDTLFNLDSRYYSVLVLFGIVILYLSLKTMIDWLLYALMNQSENFNVLFKNKLYIRVWFILFWLVLTFVVYYSPLPSIYLSYIILGSFVLEILSEYYMHYRLLDIPVFKYSFYIILYLCTLDILPLLYITRQWFFT